MFERGRAHPILGPILLIVLIVVLAMVYLHAAHEGHEAATEVGVLCLAVVTLLGPALIERLRRQGSEPVVAVRGDRGPPRRPEHAWILRPADVSTGWRMLPLRR